MPEPIEKGASEESSPPCGDLATVAVLADPIRMRLYRHLEATGLPSSRDEIAVAVGMPPHTVRSHLERLVEVGLLEVEFHRPPGRSGPGAGRTTKYYRLSAREVSVGFPERRYQLAAALMADAIRVNLRDGTPITEALRRLATTTGRELGTRATHDVAANVDPGARIDGIQAALDYQGYATRRENDQLVLGNCPFLGLLGDDTMLICCMSHDFIEGVLEGAGMSTLTTAFIPGHTAGPGRCCVAIAGLETSKTSAARPRRRRKPRMD